MATFSISKKHVVTLKYYPEKNIDVEITLLFNAPWGKLNTSSKWTVKGSPSPGIVP